MQRMKKLPFRSIDTLDLEEFRDLVQQSGMFDPSWYLDRNHDVRSLGRDPLDHFLRDGAREGRDPGPDFDTTHYVKQHSGINDTGLSPFEHFLRFGQHASAAATESDASAGDTASFAQRVRASGLFDTAWYLAQNQDVRRSGRDPFEHFVADGAWERRDPGPDFNTAAYVERAGSVDFSKASPFEHYLNAGEATDRRGETLTQDQQFRELLRGSGLFNQSWYLAHNPDIQRSGIEPFDHVVRFGAAEGRDPGPGFQAAFYAEQNPGVFASGLSPLEHYLRVGRAAGATPKGPDAYTQWIERYDELTASDRARISADGAASSFPTLVCLHVLSDGAVDTDELRTSLTAQIGIAPEIRIVAPQGGFNTPDHAIDDLPDDAILVLSGGQARLRPHAVYVLANIMVRECAAAAYSDHDHEAISGQRTRPVFKPEMSPDFMARQPYAGPVIAVRIDSAGRDRIAAALAMAARGDPSAAFAALLLGLDPVRVKRVPLPLYSLPVPVDGEEDARDVGAIAPVRGDDRTEVPSPAGELPQVIIVIPTRDSCEILKACIDSLLVNTDYPPDRFRVLVVDNGSREPDSLTYLRQLAEHPRCAVVSSPGPFNFAKICNDGATAADGEMLVFLNNDMTVIAPDWLAALAAHAVRPEIGVVGAQLLYPDDTVQHGGVLLGLQGVAGHHLQGVPAIDARRRDITRELTAVTGACLAVRRTVFEEIGGFDEALAVAFNDVALCMRAHEAGYRNLYLARPLLYHHESKSRGYDDTPEKLARNRREAIYARERFARYFRDDPAYNPNMSLQKPGELAVSPRVVRPWRRSPARRRALILSVGHGLGHGVGRVVALQVERLLARGWNVAVGGPVAQGDRLYPGCQRVRLETAADAAAFAVAEGFDCVVAHTPPFFSVTRYLGQRPLFYAYDHGEPPPEMFDDRVARENIDWEKRFCAPLAHRVFCISNAIRAQQYRRDAVVLRNGNGHLATWSAEWASRRASLRHRFGFEGRFVVLDVCRFHRGERRYKGVDAFASLAAEFPYVAPAAGRTAVFALAGRGDDDDIAFVRAAGLTVFPNVSDIEMAELYAASDLYVGLSRWEGYDLGVGQALAMGLDVIASDIPAHREFGVPVANSTPELCGLVGAAFERWDPEAIGRAAHIDDWDEPLTRMVDLMEEDLAADAARSWL